MVVYREVAALCGPFFIAEIQTPTCRYESGSIDDGTDGRFDPIGIGKPDSRKNKAGKKNDHC